MFFLPGPTIDTGLVLKGPPCLNKDDLTLVFCEEVRDRARTKLRVVF